jgi:ParB family chromosome partitioning protein
MAKLKAPAAAGWNAGKNYYAKTMKIEDIIIDPEIARLFKMSDATREEIKESITKKGYDKGQPLSLWKDKNLLLDGHTRLAAAKEAGLIEVPVVEMDFEDKEDAILYTFERQVMRRNLTQEEIVTAVKLMPAGRARRGEGSTAGKLAGRLGISEGHIYQVQAILREGSPEDIEAVKSGEKPVKTVYTALRPPKKDRAVEEAGKASVEARLDILKSAVTLLAEAKEEKAALLVVHHFFKKHEREAFIKLLPKNVRERLCTIPV